MAKIAAVVIAFGALAAAIAGACSSGEPSAATGGTGGSLSDGEPPDAPAVGGAAGKDANDGPQIDGSDLPPELAWLGDPTIWKPVPGLEFTAPCTVYEPAPGTAKFQPLDWQPCGTGCESADAVQGIGESTANPVASVHRIEGSAEPMAAVSAFVKTEKKVHDVRRFFKLRSGTTAASFQWVEPLGITGGCGAVFRKAGASLFTGVSGNGVGVSGYVDSSADSIRWALPPLPNSSIPIDYWAIGLDSGPHVFGFEPGNVWGLLDFDLHEWTLIEGNSTIWQGAAEGDLAVFLDQPYGGNPRLRGWRSDGLGMRTLAEPIPPNTCLVALTPTHVVGQTSESPDCIPKQPKLWLAPRSALGGGAPPLSFIDLTPIGAVYISTSGLRAWGDHAALTTFDPKQFSGWRGMAVVVAELSTGKLWKVSASQGYGVSIYTAVVDGTHLYYGETAVENDIERVTRFMRIDLSLISSAPNVVPL